MAKENEAIFKTGTSVSDGGSWLSTLLRRQTNADEKPDWRLLRPITAAPDPFALKQFIETPPIWKSLWPDVRDWVTGRWTKTPIRMTAKPVPVAEIWSRRRMAAPRLISIGVHLAIIALLLIPFGLAPRKPALNATNIVLLQPEFLLPPAPPEKPGGGGGGGNRSLTPPSLGRLPRPSVRQFVPPTPEPPKNLDPSLVMEPTVISPQLPSLPQLALLNVGDPNGVPGPPSAGPGSGGGIGTGAGHGIGSGTGPGVGPGSGGGYGGGTEGGYGSGVYHIGGGVTGPVVIREVMPQYSEEARKARFEGTVVLETIVHKDGTLTVNRVLEHVGYGLDEQAIAAAEQWLFRPGTKNGQPVDVLVEIQVNFNLR